MLIALIMLTSLGLLLSTLWLSRKSLTNHPPIGTQMELQHHAGSRTHSGHIHLKQPSQVNTNKPVIVLIHGASTSLLDFEPSLYPHLEKQFSVYSVDRPGHGYSDRFQYLVDPKAKSTDQTWVNPRLQASLILEALEQANVENAIWVGHSLGASIVLAAMLEFPNKVRAGVIIGGGSHPWTGPPAWHIALSVKPILGRLFTWHFVETLGRLMLPKAVETVFAPERMTPEYIERTGIHLTLRPATYRYNAIDRSSLSHYLETQALRYSEITQPLLSIASTEDLVVPDWNHHDRLVKQVNQLQTLKFEGAGHAMHHTRATAVSDAITSFARNISPD